MAGAAALVCYGVAAQLAAEKAAKVGPGSFQIEFLNALHNLTADDVHRFGYIEKGNKNSPLKGEKNGRRTIKLDMLDSSCNFVVNKTAASSGALRVIGI